MDVSDFSEESLDSSLSILDTHIEVSNIVGERIVVLDVVTDCSLIFTSFTIQVLVETETEVGSIHLVEVTNHLLQTRVSLNSLGYINFEVFGQFIIRKHLVVRVVSEHFVLETSVNTHRIHEVVTSLAVHTSHPQLVDCVLNRGINLVSYEDVET